MWRHQVIITSLSDDEADKVIIKGSLNIHQKAISKGINAQNFQVDSGRWNGFSLGLITQFFGRIKALKGDHATLTRVHIRGHGGFRSQTVGGLDADTWARLLSDTGMPSVGVVSVTGCQAARDLGTAGTAQRLTPNYDSFASRFHIALKGKGIKCDVMARAEYVGVMPDGSKKTTLSIEKGETDWGAHRDGSKVKFKWVGESQMREVVRAKYHGDPFS